VGFEVVGNSMDRVRDFVPEEGIIRENLSICFCFFGFHEDSWFEWTDVILGQNVAFGELYSIIWKG